MPTKKSPNFSELCQLAHGICSPALRHERWVLSQFTRLRAVDGRLCRYPQSSALGSSRTYNYRCSVHPRPTGKRSKPWNSSLFSKSQGSKHG